MCNDLNGGSFTVSRVCVQPLSPVTIVRLCVLFVTSQAQSVPCMEAVWRAGLLSYVCQCSPVCVSACDRQCPCVRQCLCVCQCLCVRQTVPVCMSVQFLCV